jgi:phosphate transport system permease protein
VAGASSALPTTPARFRRRRSRLVFEQVIGALLFLCAAVTVLTTAGIVLILVGEGTQFFREVNPVEFFTGTRWTPLFTNKSFGVLPLVSGTLVIAVGSALVALPVGSVSAIFLAEYASPRVRGVIKPTLEVLAGIPTVVYGYFALTFITPLLQATFFPDLGVFNALSAIVVIGVMIIPMVSSLSDDALRAVPRDLREAAYGVGATKFEVVTRVTFPAALSGIIASYILAVSRAIGETMIVLIAAGATPNLSANPLQSFQTMTSFIASVSLGDTPQGTTEYNAIFAVALTLFVMTFTMNLVSNWIVGRFREAYE